MCTSSPTLLASFQDPNDDDTTTSRVSGAKRSLPDSSESDSSDEELKRKRHKNRTNSKRFRDRKKNYMDCLFEQKYRLGKANDALRDDNEKLRRRLEEAIRENQAHKRNSALGPFHVQTRSVPPTPAYLHQSVIGMIPPNTHALPTARHITPLVDADKRHPNVPRIETELISLQQGQPGSTPNVWLVISRAVPDSLEAYNKGHGLEDMTRCDIGSSAASHVLKDHHSTVVVGPPSL